MHIINVILFNFGRCSIDILANVLKEIRLSSRTYFCADFETPWGMDIPSSQHGGFHIAVTGEFYVYIKHNHKHIHLKEGDIIAFPLGAAHQLSDNNTDKAADSLLNGESVVEAILSGNNPFEPKGLSNSLNTVLCGAFNYDTSLNHPLFNDLPEYIHIKSSELPWLQGLVSVLSNETRTAKPGYSVLVDRLTEVLFIQLLRAHMLEKNADSGFLSALNDSKINAALTAVHQDLQGNINVGQLGELVGMSRTSFNQRFTKLVGESPKTYLTNFRLQNAKNSLLNNNSPIIQIAENAGYSSEAAFSKAFKRYYKVPPGSVRKKSAERTLDN